MAASSDRRAIRLTPEGARVLRELRDRFQHKFGRPPGPGDPVSFEARVDASNPVDQDRFDATMVTAMEAADVDGALIHAYRRTGMLITEFNLRRCSAEDLARWQAAIEEYEELGLRER